MSWDPEIKELKRRTELARQMGGAENETTRLGVNTRRMRP